MMAEPKRGRTQAEIEAWARQWTIVGMVIVVIGVLVIIR